jgi:alpha-1,2-mannosyltransferase
MSFCGSRADDSDSGGGGERVLWSAIAYLQRTQQDVVSLVYTGDFPSGGTDADKERIINNVNVSFPGCNHGV